MNLAFFAAIADWPQYLREAVDHPAGHVELTQIEPNAFTMAEQLGALSGELDEATRSKLLDGALTVVETGTAAQAAVMVRLSLEDAPRAAARIGVALRARRAVFDDSTVDTLISRALRQDAWDAQLTAAVDGEAQRRVGRMLFLMAPYRSDWVAAHVERVTSSSDPGGQDLAGAVLNTKAAELPRVIDALVAAGPDHVARLQAAMAGWPERSRQKLAPVLAANPAFAKT